MVKMEKTQEDNGGRLKWSKFIESQLFEEKNTDTNSLLRETIQSSVTIVERYNVKIVEPL